MHILAGGILVTSEQIVSPLLFVFMMILKLYLNNEATAIQKKTLWVSIPSELTVLSVGFLFSANITKSFDPINHTENGQITILIILSLILLALLYVSERKLVKNLSGEWNWKVWLRVILMYVFSVGFYLYLVFGGVL